MAMQERRMMPGGRRRVVAVGAAAVVVLAVPDVTSASSACASSVAPRVVPVWARTGFSDPEPVVPYALGEHGDVVAILFGGQLFSPEAAEVGNKVLWVARVGAGGPMHIHARLEGSHLTADVDLPDGPGPSYVDMPRAGCWQMDLTWGGGRDAINLPYVAPQAAASPSRAST
jgi:hypothetical protein